MEGLTARIVPALAVVLCASAPFFAGASVAQGFGSISSDTPAATPPASTVAVAAPPAPTTPVAIPPAVAAPPAAVPVGSPSSTVAQPSARLASLGFSSISGAQPDVAAVAPGATPAARAGAGPNTAFESADRVIVDKSERRLYLLRHGRTIAEYPVKLGLNPYGHKQQEGDFRTPEGKYTLTRRNPRSEFFLAIQVSYPNQEDMAWAKENGWEPGGLIMIHGQPNVPKRSSEFYASRDWTDGCIALSNSDMVDVWLRTSVGLPIEIRP